MALKILKCLLLTVLIVSFGTEVHAGKEFPKVTSRKWTSKYDQYFRKYAKRFFGAGFEWEWFKAQAIAESNLRQDAKSWVNAKGIMQIMPTTFHEIKKEIPSLVDINEPRWNIAAGVYYDRQLFSKWKAKRPLDDKMNFTFASYNAGFGTIVRAQKVCKRHGLNENLWQNIKKVARMVQGWRHEETVGYVERINLMME